MLYPVKIEFKDYPSGTWHDWSRYLAEVPYTNQRVESENEGEAGVIIFDSASITLMYEQGNPVYDAFSVDLTDIQRYLFRISFLKSDKTYEQRMEGMADFSTIEWPENEQNVISFEIVDKLSTLGVLTEMSARVTHTLNARMLAQVPAEYQSDLNAEFRFPENYINIGAYSPAQGLYDLDEPVVFPGEVLRIPLIDNEGNFTEYRDFIVTKPVEFETLESKIYNKVYVTPLDTEGLGIIQMPLSQNNCMYAEKEIYGTDCYNYTGSEVVSIDGISLMKSIYSFAWQGVTLVKKPSSLSFSIPLEYGIRFIDEQPLGKTPFDALIELSNSMKCYVYINKGGDLVVQLKSDLTANGTTRSISPTKVIRRKKKYFWDKLVDSVKVTVKSWIMDTNQEYLTGEGTKTKELYPGSGINISNPKNEITKEIFVNDPAVNTEEALNDYAAQEAGSILDFYGKRRSSYELELKLDDNTLQWELVDNIFLGTTQYFITSIVADAVEGIVTIEAIEIEGHDFDFRQVIVPLSEEKSVTGSSGSSTSGSSTITKVEGDYTFMLPLNLNGTIVSVKNLTVDTGNILAQRNGSTPQEYRIYNYFTNADNNEFLSLGFKNNLDLFTIETEKTGTGVIRDIAVLGGKVAIGTNNLDGLPSVGKLTIKGTSNDGTTKILVLRDSDETNVLTIDTDGNILQSADASYAWLNRSAIKSHADGNLTLSNFLLNGFGLLQFGGTSNLYPAIKRNNDEIQIRLANDSNYANIYAKDYKVIGSIGTIDYASQLTGWRVTNAGSADFRNLYADELHAKSFIADLEQTLAGSQIICKSAAKLAANYTLPAVGVPGTRLIVESFAGFENAAVFQNGDLVRLREFSRSSGSLAVADAWGNVVLDSAYGTNGFDTVSKTQAYILTRNASTPGTAAGEIKQGTLALDYGVSGNGFIESNAFDGAWGANSPYTQIVTWAGTPGSYTIHNRMGKLSGITDNDFGGALSGFGTYINGSAYIKGNIVVKASSQIALQSSSIMIGNITGAAGNAVKISQTGTAGTSGIFLYDETANELLKFALDGNRHIANWNFDENKLFKGNVSSGFSINTSSTPYITGNNSKGFEIYDANNPKMFLGSRDVAGSLSKGFDWNISASNEFTMKGNILASRFTTKHQYGFIGDAGSQVYEGVDIQNGEAAVYSRYYSGSSLTAHTIASLKASGLSFYRSADGQFNDTITSVIITAEPYPDPFDLTGNIIINGKDTDPYISLYNSGLLIKKDGITSSPESGLTGDVKIYPANNVVVNPGGKYLLPENDYDITLGTSNKKFKQLFCSEIVLQNLVRADVMATIGGRILVGETNKIKTNFYSTDNTITVENQFSGALPVICCLEGIDESLGTITSKLEFIRIDSYSGPNAGGYRYNVTRNLDGTGANNWYPGDAVFNTGSAGSGFIDLYSSMGVKGSSQPGPSIVGNIRNSSSYNDWSEAWAIGSLSGLYGQASGTFGVGLGKYTDNNSFMVITPANGIQFKNRASGVDSTLAQWSSNGNITIGSTSGAHTLIESTAIKLKSGNNTRLQLNNNGSGYLADETISWDAAGKITITGVLKVGDAASDVNTSTTTINGSKITTGTITTAHLNFSPVDGSHIISSINSSYEGITINAGRLNLSGMLTVGSAAGDINDHSTQINGSKITTGTITLSHLNFTPVETGSVIAKINASPEELSISAARLTINSACTFAPGYNPSTKTSGSDVTTIIGNTVTTGYINALNVKAGSVDAESITGNTITGKTLQTDTTGQRIVISTNGQISFYSSTGMGNSLYGGDDGIYFSYLRGGYIGAGQGVFSTSLTVGGIGVSLVGHAHSIPDITNLQTILTGKANASHLHSISELTDFPTPDNNGGKVLASDGFDLYWQSGYLTSSWGAMVNSGFTSFNQIKTRTLTINGISVTVLTAN